MRRIASVFKVETIFGRTSSAAETRRIHAFPWLRTSETPGIERRRASSTASLVSSSTKSDWTRALRAVGVPDATIFPWSMIEIWSQRASASSM